ncbi:MAG: ArgR family transcriptional regulator [Coriobacteriia bacterium]|nr:ArgR family transcriptional regulator [Coriobacteriia bacterium]
MGKRQKRHDAIRKVICENTVRTQRELADLLKAEGFDCTQATISRDVDDLGLVKSQEGFYTPPEELRLARLIAEMVLSVQAACNLVVVKTMPGAAQSVSAALDDVHLAGALGTVAGDDTIMIAAESFEAADRVAAQVNRLRQD